VADEGVHLLLEFRSIAADGVSCDDGCLPKICVLWCRKDPSGCGGDKCKARDEWANYHFNTAD
jgi:hypothetical protein